jgi:lysophospholipase L1-like esterase
MSVKNPPVAHAHVGLRATYIAIQCIGILVSLAIPELVVRAIEGAPWPEQLPLVRVKADPDVGWLMIPNDVHYTYTFRVQLNSLGFRGPEVPEKSQTEYRILAIGDSMVYGQGLKDEQLMTTRLQNNLENLRPLCHVRVINMGIRAYQTNQELALLKKVGLALKPDLVILFFYLNDFDSTNIAGSYARYNKFDWYMFDLGGKSEGENLKAWNFRQLMRHSALIARLYNLYTSWADRDGTEKKLLNGEKEVSLDRKISEIGGYIHEFGELAETHWFSFVLVAIPAAVQIGGCYPRARYQSELERFADHDKTPFLDLLPSFDRDYQITGSRHQIPFDGHYDGRGNELMADTVGEYLTNNGSGCLATRR